MMNFDLITHDKALHFIGGSIIAATAQVIHGDVLLSLAAVTGAAIGKEIYDYFHRDIHTPEVMDAVATVLGGLVALAGCLHA